MRWAERTTTMMATANRMSSADIPMFYGSNEKEMAIEEIKFYNIENQYYLIKEFFINLQKKYEYNCYRM